MGIYSVPLPAEYLFILLCLGHPLPTLAVCGSSLLWMYLTVGGGGQVACQSFLVKEAVSMFWWVELDFFCLECNEVSSSGFCDVSGFGVTLGSLYIEAQGYVLVLLENLHGMSCSGSCWLLGSACFHCRYGGF